MTVAVGMSGGTDSTMAAYLLRERGMDVIGITLVLWGEASVKFPADHLTRARHVSQRLGIRHETIDAREAFEQRIVCPFVESYQQGLTPSPCVHCNMLIKFGLMLSAARDLGCDCLATGHYARTEPRQDGRIALLCGLDPSRDQSYFLAGLTQEQLRQALFPLGTLHKQEVRRLARKHDLVPHSLGESQDLCFVPDGDYAAFVERRCADEMSVTGPILSTEGELLGTHQGIHRYTVGQRRGLGLGGGPWYVVRIEAQQNAIVVGRREEACGRVVKVKGMNWILAAPPVDHDLRIDAQLRYNMTVAPATVRADTADQATVTFDAPVHAITPGQFAVFRDGDTVLGGGWIVGAGNAEHLTVTENR